VLVITNGAAKSRSSHKAQRRGTRRWCMATRDQKIQGRIDQASVVQAARSDH